MSDYFLPGPSEKARIQKLGYPAILCFFDEISSAAMQRLNRSLPTIDGFRKTSGVGIQKQKETLARRLSRPGARDSDYRALYLIWRAWIGEHFHNVDELPQYIAESEETERSREEGGVSRLRRTNELLKMLQQESQKNVCSRESIRTFFSFSFFPETPESSEIIASAKAASDIERDSALVNLPKRLREDESEIQSIKEKLEALSRRFDQSTASIVSTIGELTKWRGAVNDFKSADVLKKTSTEYVQLSDGYKRITGDVNELRKELAGATERLEFLAQLQVAVEEMRGLQEKYSEQNEQRDRQVEECARALSDVTMSLKDLREGGQGEFDFKALMDRIVEMERRTPSAIPSSSGPGREKVVDESESNRGGKVAVPRWEPLVDEGQDVAAVLNSHSELTAAYASALYRIGLRKTAAQIFAEECAAGVLARQVIFLQGAHATQVARDLARVTGGAKSARLSIPVGFLDDWDLRQSIGQVGGAENSALGAISVEGINRTSFDVLKDILAECVDPNLRPTTIHGKRIAVFGTIVSGLAALPIEPEYFELGPIFDLDYLDWRSVSPLGSLSASVLSGNADRAFREKAEASNAGAGEANHLARCFLEKRNPAVERVVAQAFQTLTICRSDPKGITALQSLYFGWLLPRWLSLRISKENIDSELDGGRADGANVDLRLANMLAVAVASDTNAR